MQLKLSNKVKNLFEYCELHLPFFHRFVLVFNLGDLLLIIIILLIGLLSLFSNVLLCSH